MTLYGCASGGAATLLALSLATAAGAQTTYTESVLHSFAGTNATNGGGPSSALVRDPSGNFYGTKTSGGAWNQGVVFKIDIAGNLTVLHNFTGGSDGGHPIGNMLLDEAGNLFGATEYGGDACGDRTCGLVYELEPSGQETVLLAFSLGNGGYSPSAGLARDGAGNLYGTTG